MIEVIQWIIAFKYGWILGVIILTEVLLTSLIIIGLIRPKYVIRWGNLRNRTKVLLYYGVPVLLLVGVMVLLQPTMFALDKREIQKQWVMFPGVFVAQVPLEMRNNSVVGIKGIIVNETTLNEAIESFNENPYTVKNFRFTGLSPDATFRLYKASQQMGMIFLNTSLMIKNNVMIENNIIREITVQMTMKDENVLKEAYKEILQERKAKLGHPSLEEAELLVWHYPGLMYIFTGSRRTDNGKLQIINQVF